MKQLLIIAKDFWPAQSAGAQRLVSFVENLPSYGWEPTVLTVDERVYERIDMTAPISDEAKARIRRSFALDNKRHLSVFGRYPGALDRPDRYMSWRFAGISAGRDIIRRARPDAILSTYPVASAHVIARRLAHEFNIPWAADFRDPFKYRGKKGADQIRSFFQVERNTVFDADRLIFTTEAARTSYAERFEGVADVKSSVVANGFEEQLMAAAEARARDAVRPAGEDEFLIIHNGHLYGDERNPEIFLRAVRALLDRRAFDRRPRILFRGSQDFNLDDVVTKLGLNDYVEFRPSAPFLEAAADLYHADCLLLLQGDFFSVEVPSKAYEYIAVRKPILALTNPRNATAQALTGIPWSAVAPITDQDAIEGALCAVMAAKPDPSFDTSAFGRSQRAPELAAILDNMTGTDVLASRMAGRAPVAASRSLNAMAASRARVSFGCGADNRLQVERVGAINQPRFERPQLLLFVDVEEEFDWRRPRAGVEWRFEALDELREFQARIEALGVMPCYLIDYPIVDLDAPAAQFGEWAAAGRCLVGAQLHAWVTPPFEETSSLASSYQGNLPFEAERAKMEAITSIIRTRIGVQPKIFRAGRYGFGASTLRIMKSLGYEVDVSVMPNTTYAFEDGGPDAVHAPDWPFWLDPERTVLEIPPTRPISGRLKSLYYRNPFPVFDAPAARATYLSSFVARMRLLERVTFSPEGHDLADVRRMIDEQLEWGRKVFAMSLHSSSLVAGGSSYARTQLDADAMFEKVSSFIEFCLKDRNFEPTDAVELRARYVAAAAASEAVKGENAVQRAANNPVVA